MTLSENINDGRTHAPSNRRASAKTSVRAIDASVASGLGQRSNASARPLRATIGSRPERGKASRARAVFNRALASSESVAPRPASKPCATNKPPWRARLPRHVGSAGGGFGLRSEIRTLLLTFIRGAINYRLPDKVG
jgi:hypothetical protein